MAKESCKIVAIEHLTLDGIYQAPARKDEDTRGGRRFFNEESPFAKLKLNNEIVTGTGIVVATYQLATE